MLSITMKYSALLISVAYTGSDDLEVKVLYLNIVYEDPANPTTTTPAADTTYGFTPSFSGVFLWKPTSFLI